MTEEEINSIHIEDWQDFLDDNEIINKSIDDMSACINNIYSNCTALPTLAESIYSNLSSLKTVNVIRKIRLTTGRSVTMDTCAKRIEQDMAEKGVKVVAGLSYAEKVVEANCIIPDEKSFEQFKKIMTGVVDSNILWYLSAIDKLPAAAFLFGTASKLAYVSDAFNGGDFIVGDGTMKLFEPLLDQIAAPGSTTLSWLNVGTGALAVTIFETGKALYNIATDEGDLTEKDKIRIAYGAGISAITFVEWTAIAEFIPGGFGVVAATTATMISKKILNSIVDEITGDKIIDEFYSQNEKGDWVQYKVPKNGSGKDGTAKIIIKRANKEQESSEDHDVMYYDWYEYVSLDKGESYIDEFDKEMIDSALDYIGKYANSADEARDLFYNYNHISLENARPIVSGTLIKDYDFDIGEWWEQNHE